MHSPSNMPSEYIDIKIVGKTIPIWEPRWHDDVVLIDKRRVQGGWNKIVFTKTNSLPGEYCAKGEDISRSKVGSNGKITCYEYPLKNLKIIGKPLPKANLRVEAEQPEPQIKIDLQEEYINNDIRR